MSLLRNPIAIVMALALCLSACAQRGPIPSGPSMISQSGSSAADPVYRLSPGDKLKVTTFGEPALTGTFEVSAGGAVSLPLIGEVRAAGLSPGEFQKSVVTALAGGFIRDPSVSVEVINYRPFYILGEVNKPGEYPYAQGLTVLNAVATANGFTYRAEQRRVFIKRAGENVEQEVLVTTSTLVSPGDTIRFAERYF